MGRLDDARLQKTVSEKADLFGFGSENAAVYHGQKHYPELPAAEQRTRGGEMTRYLSSARATLAHPDSVEVRVNQDGSRSFIGDLRDKAAEWATVFRSQIPDGIPPGHWWWWYPDPPPPPIED